MAILGNNYKIRKWLLNSVIKQTLIYYGTFLLFGDADCRTQTLWAKFEMMAIFDSL